MNAKIYAIQTAECTHMISSTVTLLGEKNDNSWD
jgi:hypothetical protein